MERLHKQARESNTLPLQDRPSVIFIRSDHLLDIRIYRALARRCGTFLVNNTGEIFAAHVLEDTATPARGLVESAASESNGLPPGCKVAKPLEIAQQFDRLLRKSEPPFLIDARRHSVDEIEKTMFDASYKGVTDVITRYLWPKPAYLVTRFLSRAGISPNMVTSAGFVLTCLVCYFFLNQNFLAGLAAAWLMTFLDTVDGKLARVTLTSSRVGGILDHAIDLLHPPLWWGAFWVGVSESADAEIQNWLNIALVVIIAGYVLGRVVEFRSKGYFGFNMFLWRPFDTAFRLVMARRNPNLVLLTVFTVLGSAAAGYIAVAVWTLISLMGHLGRTYYAAGLKRKRRGNLSVDGPP